MFDSKNIMFINAITDLHPGGGTATGMIDMPVQRERHTSWPIIQGSSIKGVLRDEVRAKEYNSLVKDDENIEQKLILDIKNGDFSSIENESLRGYIEEKEGIKDSEIVREIYRFIDEQPKLNRLFGNPGNNGELNAGALSITDARILFFPVRSFHGVYALVTCPSVLERFANDLKLVGADSGQINEISEFLNKNKFSDYEVIITSDSEISNKEAKTTESETLNDEKVILEEFVLKVFKPTKEENNQANESESETISDSIPSLFNKRHALVSDHVFTYLVNYATVVQPRIALDYSSKTTKQGALFYEEFLPPETVMYSVVLAAKSRVGNCYASSQEIMKDFMEMNEKYIQIGGDETIGKGICQLSFLKNANIFGAESTKKDGE